jgi:putative ABC transport system permease protein
MNHLLRLAALSAWNRRYALGLTLLAIVLSSTLLFGIERLRQDVRTSFTQSVSGTDLIVGTRGSPLQLMLFTVFRLGEPTGTLRWESAQALARHPDVAWTIPIALGDSHRGFPVIGTNADYFAHFHYGAGHPLRVANGQPFDQLFDAVLGADVARRLGYRVGDRIVLAHGSGGLGLAEHADKPFVVSGILAPTGTPVDRSVHISLEALEAIHLDWQGGAPLPGVNIPAEYVRKFDLTPKAVTAVLIGLKSRSAVFAMQREISRWPDEPLTAALPAVALDELWRLLDSGEQALRLVSALAMISGLAGMVAVMLAGLDQRRRELSILRSVGAAPRHVFTLLAVEGIGLTLLGALLGIALQGTLVLLGGHWLEARYGIAPSIFSASREELTLLAAIVLAGSIASLLPGYRAYRLSLNDGLTPRL